MSSGMSATPMLLETKFTIVSNSEAVPIFLVKTPQLNMLFLTKVAIQVHAQNHKI